MRKRFLDREKAEVYCIWFDLVDIMAPRNAGLVKEVQKLKEIKKVEEASIK